MSEEKRDIIVPSLNEGEDPVRMSTREAQGHITYRTGRGYWFIELFESLGGKKFEPWALLAVVLFTAGWGTYYSVDFN